MLDMGKSWNPWSGCIFMGEVRMEVMLVGLGNEDEMKGKMMISQIGMKGVGTTKYHKNQLLPQKSQL